MSTIISLSRSHSNRLGLQFLGNWTSSQQLQIPSQRQLHLTPAFQGKRNVRKFFLGNKRGSKIFRRQQVEGKYSYAPLWTPVKPSGYLYNGEYHPVPEMHAELVVPDLTDCQLKPYVSYRTADIYQSQFTAQDLFDVVYRRKISQDFKEGKLDSDGNPLEPSEMEQLTPDQAWTKARQSGSDIFSERIPRQWECLEKDLISQPEVRIQVSSVQLEHPTERKRRLEASGSGSSESTPTLKETEEEAQQKQKSIN